MPIFFCFSFHEMGMYDMPAIIDFVLAKTGQQQIFYVGYSQGATVGMLSNLHNIIAQKC